MEIETKITLTLTESEADALANLMDAAVRAQGLPAAVAAVPFFNKLKECLEAAKAANV